jgi:hypothetical protein
MKHAPKFFSFNWNFALGLWALCILTSCNFNFQRPLPLGNSNNEEGNVLGSTDKLNFENIKTKVFDVSCVGCHTTVNGKVGNKGGVNFDTYASTKQFLAATRAEVFGGTMPPVGASAKISKAQADFLILWIDRGAPEVSDPSP